MRLGEIKQKLDRVIDSSKRISIKSEPMYGGQRYKVINYQLIIDALFAVKGMSWVEYDFSLVQEVVNKHSTIAGSVELEQAEYNQITNYTNNLNGKLPVFIAMLDSVVEAQEERMVNIKIGKKDISTFTNLNKVNERIEKILKLYNVDGQFDFVGFDKGTDWYVVLAIGHLSYLALMGGLNIAEKYFNTKKAYFESEKAGTEKQRAALELEAATGKKPSNDDIRKYVEKRLLLEIEVEVEHLSDIIDATNNKNENKVKMLKATQLLIEELEKEDFEFHPSLNPPRYVEEIGGGIKLSFGDLPKISDKKETKELVAAAETKKDEN